MKILCIIGTRPEAIKMAGLIILMKQDKRFECIVCATSQHKELLHDALRFFGITVEYDLSIMQPKQQLFEITVNILKTIEAVILSENPDIILVQGDTTTTFISALAGFYSKIRIGHVEAGLRTFDKNAPYPEEMNRQMISRIADLHFAPTQGAKQNLLQENIPENKIHITGNTVIDSLFLVISKIKSIADPESSGLFPSISSDVWKHLNDNSKKIILVTAHRRENHANNLGIVCQALNELAKRDDVIIIFSVHPNPNVKEYVEIELRNTRNILLLKPLDYMSFVFLMNKSYLIITDSGGIQEEAPSLGKPVLLTRDLTERPESVVAGTVTIVGCNSERIVSKAVSLLENQDEYTKMAQINSLYGDGKSSERILEILANQLS